jgi:hypothetical protein
MRPISSISAPDNRWVAVLMYMIRFTLRLNFFVFPEAAGRIGNTILRIAAVYKG